MAAPYTLSGLAVIMDSIKEAPPGQAPHHSPVNSSINAFCVNDFGTLPTGKVVTGGAFTIGAVTNGLDPLLEGLFFLHEAKPNMKVEIMATKRIFFIFILI
jgi:hypothetical protein